MADEVRVRLAPSPTGRLHVGTARTALYNELFARQQGGAFIIRIEDTDQARSRSEFEADILEGLRWLGITWDEGPDIGGAYGPYRQSERTSWYTQALEQLLAQDKAYYDETANNVIRLRVSPQQMHFSDLVRGQVTIHSDTWGGDFVIARSLQDPLFHLAVVVDDAAQKITHVIRGEDHLTNTARHILLQNALGVPTPQYIHLPLLLDEARHKLSKRTNEVSLLRYRDLGYLPQTIVNYLALLGWSPKDNREFFTHDELRRIFNSEGIQKGGAIFSVHKLDAMNKRYLRQLSAEQLFEVALPYLAQQGITADDPAYWQAALLTEQSRVATLQELAQAVAFFRPDWPADFTADLLIWRTSTAQATTQRLQQVIQFVDQLSDVDFTPATLHKKIIAWIDTQKLDRGETLWPMRVALTGQANSPGPFEVAAVLGKTATLARLTQAVNLL